MSTRVAHRIFQKGSTTYFYSSTFFPKLVKNDVYTLYAFVRTADDFVDALPQQREEFILFKKKFEKAWNGTTVNDAIIDPFVKLMRRKKISVAWMRSFFKSMEMDLTPKKYTSIRDTQKYMYGSAEVVGLCMARILDLPKKSFPCARALGRAMQYINFIRDVADDVKLKRCYFPASDLKKSGLSELSVGAAQRNPHAFKRFMRLQIERYRLWQTEAEKGFGYIPAQYLTQIKTASDMYLWTAKCIEKDPFIVFKKKVKPSILRILVAITKNAVIIK